MRTLYQELMDGWNRGSGTAFATVFTDDGDLVAFDGTHFKGREEIVPFHQQLFEKWLKGTRLVGNVKDVRFLSPEVALMHAVGSTVMRGKSEPSPERDSIQTLVAVREGGRCVAPCCVPEHSAPSCGPQHGCVPDLDVFRLAMEGFSLEQENDTRVTPYRKGETP